MKKCKCQRFKEAVKDGEIRARTIMENCPECGSERIKKPIVIKYSLCVVEGKEPEVFYCLWCGGKL